MNENYLTGRFTFIYFYVFETIVAIIAGEVTKNLPDKLRYIIIAYLILSIVFIFAFPGKKAENEQKNAYIHSILFVVMSTILGGEFDNTQVFIYAVFVHSVVMISYIDTKIYTFNIILNTLSLISMFFVVRNIARDTFHTNEYIIGAIGACGVQWLAYGHIKSIAFQTRRSLEQERSLDDMLKVVEAKCEEARQATKSKSEFLSSMSHEIRTPINAVLGMNEMILRESHDSNIVEYATNVAASGKMLLSLVNDVLDFSKIESGKMEIIPVEYQVSSVLNDLINMIRSRAEEKGLKLLFEIDENVPNFLCGDEVRIRQVVSNLLTNAVKYTDTGSITLKLDYNQKSHKEIELIFQVKDTGIGIKEEDVTHLFDQFMRMEEKKNRNIEGTGLGLSITKRFVDMMNGNLSVDSVYGQGSTFSVKIPQIVVKNEPMGDFKKQYDAGVKSQKHYNVSFVAPGAKILVVDDNEMNLKVITGLLKQTQIQVDTATSGKECLEILGREKYNILFLDHMMPGLDGLATHRRIIAQGLGENMPIIALTANAVSGAREMYLDYGFADYLSKPIISKDLEKILYNHLPVELIKEADFAETIKTESINSQMLDTDKGIELCGNDKEFYREILLAYYEQGYKQIDSLNNYYNESAWREYEVLVHSIKSKYLNIGAIEFSEKARLQEQAAKLGDEDYIKNNFDGFIDEFKVVLDEINRILNV